MVSKLFSLVLFLLTAPRLADAAATTTGGAAPGPDPEAAATTTGGAGAGSGAGAGAGAGASTTVATGATVKAQLIVKFGDCDAAKKAAEDAAKEDSDVAKAFILALASQLPGINTTDVEVALKALGCPRRLNGEMGAPARQLAAAGDVQADYKISVPANVNVEIVKNKLSPGASSSSLKSSLQNSLATELKKIPAFVNVSVSVAAIQEIVPTPVPTPASSVAVRSQAAIALLTVMVCGKVW